MADILETLKNLPEIIKNATEVKDLFPTFEKIQKQLQNTSLELEKLKKAGITTGNEFTELTQRHKELTEASISVSRAMDGFGSTMSSLYQEFAKIKDAPNGFNELKSSIVDAGESLKDKLMPAIKQNVGLLAVNSSSWVRDIVTPARDFNKFSTGAFAGLNQSLRDLLNVQNIARTNFMGLGASLKEAQEQAELFPERMRASANALGLGVEEAKKYNESVMTIPDALKVADSSLVNFNYLQNKSITISQLAQVGMKAWGLSSSEAANIQTRAYDELGRSGESMINMLGEIHGAIKDGFMPAKQASNQILNASSSLGIFGDKASIATSIWREFAESLRNGGVAAKEVGNIVSQVTQSIANMSIQNRAFIGMMSNMFQGATALGGGLRMELMMRQPGGLEKNLEALTSSLSQFGGGQIFTLEQAANNPQMEMQFALQRQMLGKLTGIGGTEQQNRILEVLQGVQRGGLDRIEGSKQLNDLMERGTDVQANTVTAIEKLERNMVNQLRQSNEFLSGINGLLGGEVQKIGMGETENVLQSPNLRIGSAQSIAMAGQNPEQIVKMGFARIGEQLSDLVSARLRERKQEGYLTRNPQANIPLGEIFNSIARGMVGEEDIKKIKEGTTPREFPADALIPINRPNAEGLPSKPTSRMSVDESKITIMIEGNGGQIKEITKKVIENELPRYINGEFVPGDE